ncbi:NADH-ubiquinone/plastoquinone oxidoreductase chain 6 [Thiovulum sp. ES]|nr:NADH-ubiquinone/plastoquinone oxidoreductase chain 6 [Thiovulum sp. ES]
MNIEILLLIAVPILAVISLLTEKSVTALLTFSGMMFLLGIYYISMELQLLGFLQIFIYTGGIAVLMLFGLSLVGNVLPKGETSPFEIFSLTLFVGVISYAILTNLPEGSGELTSQTQFPSELLVVFAVIVSSLIYGSVKVISISKKRV